MNQIEIPMSVAVEISGLHRSTIISAIVRQELKGKIREAGGKGRPTYMIEKAGFEAWLEARKLPPAKRKVSLELPNFILEAVDDYAEKYEIDKREVFIIALSEFLLKGKRGRKKKKFS